MTDDVVTFLNQAGRGTLTETMGIEFISATPERLVATMPVAPNRQPYGLLHGGASCVLAETMASMGSALHAGPQGMAVGIEINATHHASAKEGVVTGTATALRLGRQVASYEVVITDEHDKRVCTARVTCLVRSG